MQFQRCKEGGWHKLISHYIYLLLQVKILLWLRHPFQLFDRNLHFAYSSKKSIKFLIFFYSRESKYIGVLMAVTIPSWLAWVLSATVLNESFAPVCFGFGLIGICLITFVIMFVPKSRQLVSTVKTEKSTSE